MIAPNTVLRDRYRIIHQLGHGGMGAVYQAMDENLSCLVAVKETFAANDEQRRAFRREAELLANLSHPNLPRVTDHFTDNEGQFLVMQFVPGHDLAELLELREQPFPVAKVLDWADQILDALEELHSSNPPIIHRDIKPANLKVTPKGRVWLLDFGLAKGAAGQMSTVDEDSRGKSIYGYTANYAPIEQIRGAGTDPRSDLYSLAATMWTLLTTQAPPDALSRLAEKEEGNPDPLRPAQELNSQVPDTVSSALDRAMAVNRNQRYATAAELRDALREARDAKFENPTQPMVYVPAAEPSNPRPPEPTVQAPKPAPPPPARQPAGPTIQSPQREVMKPAVSAPTMRVDAPPSVPTQEGKVAAPTSAPLPIDGKAPRESRKRVPMIAAAVLVVAAVAIGLAVWRPWSNERSTSTKTGIPVAPAGMVYVSGGDFLMGRESDSDESERPAHQVSVKAFFIDTYEVTNEDYGKFVKAASHNPPATWTGGNYSAGAGRQPVTGVTWDDANDYARWAGKRLPTEAEWEFAARGADGRRYPWGDQWQQGSANANGAGDSLVDVGLFKGASPFGVYDMVGNAWEWTAGDFKAYPGGRLPANSPKGELKVIRGGSYGSGPDVATTSFRFGWQARGGNYDQTGFRCAKDVAN